MKKITLLLMLNLFCFASAIGNITSSSISKKFGKNVNALVLENSLTIDFKTGDDNLDHRDF
ncbi:hypothetical protein [Kaistella jeonii]|uniref:Uncharacterized protein n=1 Tax=Kaistella jeonii TaxID=266749 RepID=A0A0C1D4M9_9FLAO|nr:hypothetical protein [Kaistella jeonii]KIA88695.1 hypothetical protein OA86_10035 [Kaistella jeonii]SFC10345.1 hypothetical protein SAMN05421876_106153 [Kaistella jeonii]VEI95273.1 Uncharacterised protein [Kaistella jeonii]